MKKQLIFSTLFLFTTFNANAMAFRRFAQAAASNSVARNLVRRASSVVQKWEYFILDVPRRGNRIDIEKLDKILTQLGDEGWRVVTGSNTYSGFSLLGSGVSDMKSVVLILERPKVSLQEANK